MEVVVVYRGRVRAPREARVVFWEGVRSGLGWQDAAVAAGFPRGGRLWFRAAGGVKGNGAGPVSGRYLSLAEREEIAVGRAAGDSMRVIAARLGRAPSTVSRELQRNCLSRGRYRAVAAQRRAEDRARRPKRAKLAGDDELRGWVQGKLRKRWSPEQISRRLAAEFPDRPEMRVSHETIYQSLYVRGRGALRRELAKSLRTGRALRKPRRRDGERRGTIKDMVMISERPAEAADRAVPGHWEGDLLVGAHGKSAIGTLVERTTRFTMLVPLPEGHDAPAMAGALTPVITALPDALRRSLTWDQGWEMRGHAQISVAADCEIYFCDPHSPWQRGSNENTNGLLRQYFPKGTSLAGYGPGELAAVADELNGRPRKTLGWKTPAEALAEILDRDAAA
ncbi:MAG TPA: IS30 family transposase [Streptosporangiaceae bacterium]|nr:IS30 family transposase [Streptosporangiaceae bacterium]